MNGRSHTAVNAFSALTLNSLFHTVGAAYTWHQLTTLVTSPQLEYALLSPLLLYKTTYYALVILCARLPDIDQHNHLGRLLGGHRGFTHSLLGVLLISLFFATLVVSLPVMFAMSGMILQPMLFTEVKIALEAFVTGWVLHIVADSITRGGVPLFWPSPTRYGFPPKSIWRFKVGTIWEDLIVWAIIFLAGFGIGTGLLGL